MCSIERGSIQCTNQNRNLHLSKIWFLFPVSFTIEHSRHCRILSVHGICCWSLERCAHQSLKTAEIRIRTPPKSANCFRFVSQIGVDAMTFLSRLQNLVKIGKELWTKYLIETKSGIRTSLKSDFYFRFQSPLNTKSAFLNFICARYWCWSVDKCRHQSLKTAKTGIRTPLKLVNDFRFVSQTISVEATTFPSRMQNLVKMGEELWT